MKVGGRIIQSKNISVNTDREFQASYKRHYISVTFHSQNGNSNPEWDIDVRHFDGGAAAMTIVQRCTIHDAIVYALDASCL